jgi:hypothetical protein
VTLGALSASWPGATNRVTSIADASMDSTPMVAITGQVRSNLIGTDAFQEVDITGISMPIVKHSWLVQDVEELPGVMKAAFHVARTGRQGPVLVDVAKDVQEAAFDFVYPDEVDLPAGSPTQVPSPVAGRRARSRSQRPMSTRRRQCDPAKACAGLRARSSGSRPAGGRNLMGRAACRLAPAELRPRACTSKCELGAQQVRPGDRRRHPLRAPPQQALAVLAPGAVIHFDIDTAGVGPDPARRDR